MSKNDTEIREIRAWNNLPIALTNDETIQLIEEYKKRQTKRFPIKKGMRFIPMPPVCLIL